MKSNFVILISLLISWGAHAQGLYESIEQALDSNPQIRLALAKVMEAELAQKSAGQQYMPTASVRFEGVERSSSDAVYAGDKSQKTLSLQQPLYTFGKITAINERSAQELQFTKDALNESRLQLSYQVIQAWGELYAAALRQDILGKSRQEHVRLSEQVGRRVEEGVAAQAELVLTVGRIRQVEAQLANEKLRMLTAQSRLELLTNRKYKLLAPKIEAQNAVHLSHLDSESLVTEHPTLQKLSRRIASVSQEARQKNAEMYPEVYVRFDRQYGNYTLRNTDPSNRVFIGMSTNLGPGVSSYYTAVSAAKKLDQVHAERDIETNNVREAVRKDLLVVLQSPSRINALTDSYQASVSTFDSFERQFSSGKKSWLEVMNAVREKVQSEVELLDAQINLALAEAKLRTLQKIESTGR
jgi:adhesin transport system outer membrane protein